MPHLMTFKLQPGAGVSASLECTEEHDASKSPCRSPYPEVCAFVHAYEIDPAAAIQEYIGPEIELRRVAIAMIAMTEDEFVWDMAVIQPTDTAQKLRLMAKHDPLRQAILTDAADELEQANEILKAHATALPALVAELHTLRANSSTSAAVIVEANFTLDAEGYKPVRTPVGPFESYEAAEVWLASLGPRWGESSVVRLTSPADAVPTDPTKEN